MRIVWKDSKPRMYKPVKYRGHTATGSPQGWTIDIPGDENVYANHYSALNAIDAALGGYGQKGSQKRQSYGIQIIGKKVVSEDECSGASGKNASCRGNNRRGIQDTKGRVC